MTRKRALRAELAALPETIPAIIKWEVYYRLGEAELDLGREQEAIESFLGAYRLLREVETELAAGWRNRLFYRMGVAYTRLGEIQNCCLRNAPESCILPIRGNAIHIEREGSLRAVECFTEVLQNSSEDTLIHMSARWLLNIAFMTLGAHPGDVPEAYLIPPEAFDSDEPFPRFATATEPLPTSRSTPGWERSTFLPRPPRGPTTTTMATWICISETRRTTA